MKTIPVVHNCTKAILVWLSPPATGVTNQTVGVWDDEYDGHTTLFNQSINQSINQSALHQKVARRSNVALEHMSMIHSLSNNVEASVYTEKRVLEQLWNALPLLGELVWCSVHGITSHQQRQTLLKLRNCDILPCPPTPTPLYDATKELTCVVWTT